MVVEQLSSGASTSARARNARSRSVAPGEMPGRRGRCCLPAGIFDRATSARLVLARRNVALGLVWGQATFRMLRTVSMLQRDRWWNARRLPFRARRAGPARQSTHTPLLGHRNGPAEGADVLFRVRTLCGARN